MNDLEKTTATLDHEQARERLAALAEGLLHPHSADEFEQGAGEAITVACMACCPHTLVHAVGIAAAYKSLCANVQGDYEAEERWANRSLRMRETRETLDRLAEMAMRLEAEEVDA